MKVIYEAKPARYVVQEFSCVMWEDHTAHSHAGDAIAHADELAKRYPGTQYRVVDTQEESQ